MQTYISHVCITCVIYVCMLRLKLQKKTYSLTVYVKKEFATIVNRQR